MRVSSHYNWRNTLRDFARNSGLLAGFCVTFIGIVLGWSLADEILFGDMTFGNISVLFLGFSAVLFISAYELLLHAKNYDVFEWSKDYRAWLLEGMPEKNWEKIMDESNRKIRVLYRYGALCYNVAIFMLYVGLFLTLAPYNPIIALPIFILGITIQLFQNKKEVRSKLSLRNLGLAFLFISILLTAFFVGFSVGYPIGRSDVLSKITHHIEVSLELSSSEVLAELKNDFPEKLNFTQLLVWESTQLNYTLKRKVHTNPIDIKNYGKGACGEFSILYVASCLANDIPARLVTDAVVDHAWAEVNPSNDNENWIHVEVTDSCVRIQRGEEIDETATTIDNPSYYEKKDFQLVLAFQVTEDGEVLIIDRTSYYSASMENE